MPQNNLARARTELAAYCLAVWPRFELAPHHRYLIDKLEAVERGECDRLIVQMPPRHGKSTLVAQLFPAWHLGRQPADAVIVGTYGNELSLDHGRRVRGFIDSDLHKLIFPKSRIADDNAASHRLGLTGGGSFFATSIGGVLTGKGGNLLILDDLVKDAESAFSSTSRKSLQQWFENVLYPRLEPGGRIVAIGTRWHESDLLGTLLREHAADGWQVINLPAIAEIGDPLARAEGEALWESRFPVEALARIREAIGTSAWQALYQQRPSALEGSIFRHAWLKTYTDQPEYYRVIFSLDCAFKTGSANDYSVIGVWGEGKSGYFLLDVVRERLDFPALMSRTIAKASFWNPHAVLIEDAASGQSLIQTLVRETRLPILPVKPQGDKESRASAVSPLFESGRVFVPQSATWLNDYLDELTSFPSAPHDDQVDSTTQALSWMRGQGNHTYDGYRGVARGGDVPRDGAHVPIPEGATRNFYPDFDAIARDEDAAAAVRGFSGGNGLGRWARTRGF